MTPRIAATQLGFSFLWTASPLDAAKAPETAAHLRPRARRRMSHELAFPGAEGFGAFAQAVVADAFCGSPRLEDNNQQGSLRWAIGQSGPRIVEFAVEGAISLNNSLTIAQPFLTLDGSTAPGGGITIRDGNLKVVQTHNIVIRHLRVRPGDESQARQGPWRGSPAQSNPVDAISVIGIQRRDHRSCLRVLGDR
jgi:hypothetical protein